MKWVAQMPQPVEIAAMPSHSGRIVFAALRECEAVVTAHTGPTAIVWGDRDPVLGRVRTRCEALLPHAEVTRTKAGHFLQEEVPAEIADAVRSVASRLPG